MSGIYPCIRIYPVLLAQGLEQALSEHLVPRWEIVALQPGKPIWLLVVVVMVVGLEFKASRLQSKHSIVLSASSPFLLWLFWRWGSLKLFSWADLQL
jgi:hypothetical protein